MSMHSTTRARWTRQPGYLCALAVVLCGAGLQGQPPNQQMQRGNGTSRPQGPRNDGPRPPGNGNEGRVQRFWQGQPGNAGPNATRGEHLQQWMQQHGNLNMQQQQQALQHESGFQQLPPEQQQRMLNRLDRLNSMSPEQRTRVLQRSEQIERLNPQQRNQIRSAMGQLGTLPPDRRVLVARSFRELRSLPPQQQNQLLNSPEYHQQFSDEERGTLGHLLSVSPILPQQ